VGGFAERDPAAAAVYAILEHDGGGGVVGKDFDRGEEID
jgi:hypothetical protein